MMTWHDLVTQIVEADKVLELLTQWLNECM